MSDPRLFAELDEDAKRLAREAKVAVAQAKAFAFACQLIGWERDTRRNSNQGRDVIRWARDTRHALDQCKGDQQAYLYDMGKLRERIAKLESLCRQRGVRFT